MTEKTKYFEYGYDLFSVYDEKAYLHERPAIILKKKDSEYYTHLLASFASTFSSNLFVRDKILKMPVENRKFDERFFQLGDEFSFSIYYEMPEKEEIIGAIHDSKNRIVYNENSIKRILHSNKISAKITDNGFIKINSGVLEKFKRKETLDVALSIDEVYESFESDPAWIYLELILKEYNPVCVITKEGVLRFQEEELNEAEEIMNSDINSIWINFGSKYSLADVIKFYMKIGYSLSGFCDVFNSHFYNFNEESGEEEMKIPKEIKKMIMGTS